MTGLRISSKSEKAPWLADQRTFLSVLLLGGAICDARNSIRKCRDQGFVDRTVVVNDPARDDVVQTEFWPPSPDLELPNE